MMFLIEAEISAETQQKMLPFVGIKWQLFRLNFFLRRDKKVNKRNQRQPWRGKTGCFIVGDSSSKCIYLRKDCSCLMFKSEAVWLRLSLPTTLLQWSCQATAATAVLPRTKTTMVHIPEHKRHAGKCSCTPQLDRFNISRDITDIS